MAAGPARAAAGGVARRTNEACSRRVFTARRLAHPQTTQGVGLAGEAVRQSGAKNVKQSQRYGRAWRSASGGALAAGARGVGGSARARWRTAGGAVTCGPIVVYCRAVVVGQALRRGVRPASGSSRMNAMEVKRCCVEAFWSWP